MKFASLSSIKSVQSRLEGLLVVASLAGCTKKIELPESESYRLDLNKLSFASVIEDSLLIEAASHGEAVEAEWLGLQGLLRVKSDQGKIHRVEWYTNTSDTTFAMLRGGADIELAQRGGKIVEASGGLAKWIWGSSVVSLSRTQGLTSLVIGPEKSLSLSEFKLGQQQADIVSILKLKQLEPEIIISNPKKPLVRVRSVKFLGRTGMLRIEQHPNGSLRQVRVSFKGVEPSEYVSLLEQIHDSLHVIGESHFDEGMDYTYFFRGDTVHCLNFYLGSCDYSMFHSSEGI